MKSSYEIERDFQAQQAAQDILNNLNIQHNGTSPSKSNLSHPGRFVWRFVFNDFTKHSEKPLSLVHHADSSISLAYNMFKTHECFFSAILGV